MSRSKGKYKGDKIVGTMCNHPVDKIGAELCGSCEDQMSRWLEAVAEHEAELESRWIEEEEGE